MGADDVMHVKVIESDWHLRPWGIICALAVVAALWPFYVVFMVRDWKKFAEHWEL